MSASRPHRGTGCRELAVDILLKVEKRQAYADILLDQSLKRDSLSAADRALLTELVYGTLRWRGRIDWHLGQFLHHPSSRTDAYLKNLLRVTLYQLLFLDRVPGYAAVNEGVELAKRYGGPKAAGLVNGVMRAILRKESGLPYPDPQKDPILHLSVRWSHPDWLVKRWSGYFGKEEIEPLLKANNEEAPLTLRVNRLKGNREVLLESLRASGLEAAATPWSPQGIQLRSRASVEQIRGFHNGLFQVQGEASQLVGFLLDPKPGERILDACAAPGGKTGHIADLMEDRGELVAADISAKALERLEQNMRRLGLKSVHAVLADVTRGLTGALALPYDRILIDAPCSGLGTLRSHPEAKWQKGEADILRLSKLQGEILRRVSMRLKPGGVMVYATCTLTSEENEQVVESFLSTQRGFALEDAAGYLPEKAQGLVSGKYFLALPHRHNTDGFFAARMRKIS